MQSLEGAKLGLPITKPLLQTRQSDGPIAPTLQTPQFHDFSHLVALGAD